MSKTEITIEFDPDRLSSYTDERLALLWHLAQANPANGFENSRPGDLAMRVGWEIIRRWLAKVPPEMYNHQQSHYYRHQLGKFAVYRPGTPDFHDGHYEARMIPDAGELRDALAAKLADLGAWAGNLTREQIAQELARIVIPSQSTGGDQDQDNAGPLLERLRPARDADGQP